LVRVTVDLPGRAYPVLIGTGAFDELPAVLPPDVKRGALVTDREVGRLWRDEVVARLASAGFSVAVCELPSGEEAKSFASLQKVVAFLEDAGTRRDGWLLALGGGTVGDVGGLAAALWLRGIRYYHLPTTLLAMVDSSVGGKTGINTAHSKNAVGAFWQPQAVIADLAFLRTLPASEREAAFGEVIKYAVAVDSSLCSLLEEEPAALLAGDPQRLEGVVARCVDIKARIVVGDERDTGQRAVLNYGHTVGHALEAASGYALSHGRAVAAGMRAAATISSRLGLCADEARGHQEKLLQGFGLPGPLPHVNAATVHAGLERDKKVRGGRLNWVLLRELGRAEPGHVVPEQLVREVLHEVLPG
jgi:3-dehydroquinate synthase